MRRTSVSLFVMALFFAPALARAEGIVAPPEPETPEPAEEAPAPDPASEVHLDLSASTHFPLSVGIEGQLELPYRILAQVHLGWMPGPYFDVINDVIVALGGYNEATAQVVAAAVESSFVLRVSAGWRPFESEGFEVLFGYTLATAGGGLSTAEAIEAGTGQTVDRTGGREVPLSATLHVLHASLAWRFLALEDHLVIRVAVGYMHTVAAEAHIDLNEGRRMPGGPLDQAEAYLVDTFTTYALSPDVRLSVGYRF